MQSLFAAGYEIRFSRTAAEGVPNKWAGEPLDRSKVEAMAKHAAKPHIAGEGGEYETLVLDAPHYRRRLVVDDARIDSSANRATWIVEKWHTQEKTV